MSGTRQKTLGEQLSQTLVTEGRGEALDAEAEDAEPLMAKPAPESPALADQLMEEVCDRGNLERASMGTIFDGRLRMRRKLVHSETFVKELLEVAIRIVFLWKIVVTAPWIGYESLWMRCNSVKPLSLTKGHRKIASTVLN